MKKICIRHERNLELATNTKRGESRGGYASIKLILVSSYSEENNAMDSKKFLSQCAKLKWMQTKFLESKRILWVQWNRQKHTKWTLSCSAVSKGQTTIFATIDTSFMEQNTITMFLFWLYLFGMMKVTPVVRRSVFSFQPRIFERFWKNEEQTRCKRCGVNR